jgi:regulator of ribonuclease activity A
VTGLKAVDIRTADLCDQFSDQLQICEPMFGDFGGQLQFGGQIATIKCFEDNSLVREMTGEPGNGRVLVVDAGGSLRRAVVGDMLGKKAVGNGWAGLIVYGCIRDCAALSTLPIGVKALGTHPVKTDKRGEGQRDLIVRFGGVTFRPGDWLYADEDGIVVARRQLID